MVLEEASSPTSNETFRDDSSPSSDSDPYSSSPQTPQKPIAISLTSETDLGQVAPQTFPPGYRMPLDKLAGPMPVLGPLFGYTREYQLQRILNQAVVASQLAKRPFTEQEASVWAWHVAKGVTISSFGYPIGVSAGIVRWYTTYNTMKFFFVKPDPAKMDMYQKFGSLRGPPAYRTWQGLRLAVITCAYGYLGSLFVSAYGLSVSLMGQNVDTRLSGLWKDIKANQSEAQAGRRSNSPPLQRVQIQGASSSSDNYDGANQNDDAYSLPGSFTGDQQNQQHYSNSDAAAREAPFRDDRMSSTPSTFGFDDASPTAGSEPLETGSVQSQASSQAQGSGQPSAWDRLRQQGPPPTQPSPSKSSPRRASEERDAWARMRGTAQVGQERQLEEMAPDEDLKSDDKWK